MRGGHEAGPDDVALRAERLLRGRGERGRDVVRQVRDAEHSGADRPENQRGGRAHLQGRQRPRLNRHLLPQSRQLGRLTSDRVAWPLYSVHNEVSN